MALERATLLSRKPLHDGKIVKLGLERVRLPGGRTVELEMVRHQGAAAVVPLVGDGDVLLVRQYRHAADGWLLEVPAGKIDPGESPETCARREVEEEIGQRPVALEELGCIFTTPGFTDERIWLYLARELAPAQQALQDDELLTIERMPFARAVAMAASGEIADGKTTCALLRAAAHLGVALPRP